MKTKEIKKLDQIWREAIKLRDKSCQVCGSSQYLNAHHIVGRRNRTLRWNLDNGILLCSGHHTFKNESAHQDPAWFMAWFIVKYPDRYEQIMKYREKIFKHTYEDELEELC